MPRRDYTLQEGRGNGWLHGGGGDDALATVLSTREGAVEHVEHMDGSGRCRTFRPTEATFRNLRLHESRPFSLHASDRIRVPGIGMATVAAIEGRTVHLEAGEGTRHRLDRDDSRLRQLEPAWSHIGPETRGAIVVLDSGDPAGQASFARKAMGAFDEFVILTAFRQHHTDTLFQAWSHAPPSRELMPAATLLDSSGESARQAIWEHAACNRLVARIDAHCRAWSDVRTTPRAGPWLDHARSLLHEARGKRLLAGTACLEDLCRCQRVMSRRASPDVRLSIR